MLLEEQDCHHLYPPVNPCQCPSVCTTLVPSKKTTDCEVWVGIKQAHCTNTGKDALLMLYCFTQPNSLLWLYAMGDSASLLKISSFEGGPRGKLLLASPLPRGSGWGWSQPKRCGGKEEGVKQMGSFNIQHGVQSSPQARDSAGGMLNPATHPDSALTCEDQVIEGHFASALRLHHLFYPVIRRGWNSPGVLLTEWIAFSLHRLCCVSTCRETFFFIALFQVSYARRLEQEKPPCEQNSTLEDFEIHAKCDLKPGIQTQDCYYHLLFLKRIPNSTLKCLHREESAGSRTPSQVTF